MIWSVLRAAGELVNKMLTIALNTFKETVRDRILAVIVLFALA